MQDWMIEDAAHRIAENVLGDLTFDDSPERSFLDRARAEVARVDEWQFSRSAVEGIDVPKGDTSGLLNTTREYRSWPTPEEDEQIAQRAAAIVAAM